MKKFFGNPIQALQWYKQGKYHRFIALPLLEGVFSHLLYKDGAPYTYNNRMHMPQQLRFKGETYVIGVYVTFMPWNIADFVAYDIHNEEIDHLNYDSKLQLLHDLKFIGADRPHMPLPEKASQALEFVAQNIYDLPVCRYNGRTITSRLRVKLLIKSLAAQRALLYNFVKFPCYREVNAKITGSELSLTFLEKLRKYYQQLEHGVTQIVLVGNHGVAEESRFFLRSLSNE